jgi:UDP-N-acetylmuramoyl-L-alanyl-D-glutamate--2,6-diaminopimelate ligase
VPVATNAFALPRPVHVVARRLAELATLAGGRLTGPDERVTGITAHSTGVRPGDLFAAVPGRSTHGARFAVEAVAAGAIGVFTDPNGAAWLPPQVSTVVVDDVRSRLGVVSAAVYGRPSARLPVVGVTGTSGKTTTTYLVRAGLAGAGLLPGVIGTVGTLIGDESLGTGLTTPEAPDLQALLAVMAERGARAVVMEVSSHALALERADGIEFAVGAFTNLSQDHLDFHVDMSDYFAAKSRLFDGRSRAAAIVVDDDWGRRLAEAVGPGAVTVSTYGQPATWRADGVVLGADGRSTFRAIGPGVAASAGCGLPGRYNVANALLALAILHQIGIRPEAAAAAVAAASVPGRMQRIEAGQPYLALVDYSHKPAAVESALLALRPLTAGRLIIVLGCGGDRDEAKRPVMGAVATRHADLLVVTDDNPRSEDPADIRAAMLAGARAVPTNERGAILEIGPRAEAIAAAVAEAQPGDTVLVAGKGHETGQEVAGAFHPFDDRAVLRAAIVERSR